MLIRAGKRSFSISIILGLVLVVFVVLPQDQITAQDSTQPEAEINTISDLDYVTTSPGRSATYSLLLKNLGNQREYFLLSIDSSYDWEISITPQTSIGLSPGESQEIKVTFDIPESLRNDDYTFKLVVKSRELVAADTIIHVVVNDNEVTITAVLNPILVIRPYKSNLGEFSPGDELEVDVEVSCYVVSADVSLKYKLLKVLDTKLLPEHNLTVVIDPESYYIQKRESRVFKVTVKFPEGFGEKVNYPCRLRLEAVAPAWEPVTKPVTIRFVIVNEPKENFLITIINSPMAIVGVASILTIGILGTAVGSTEVGKYKFLLVLFIPLYTKLHKDKILDHFTRGRVYEYIRNNPGVHYSEIKRELNLNNGNLTYHLSTLEREALIKSQTQGRFKVFYITGVKIPKDMEPVMSSVRRNILDIIRAEPGITQKELGLRLKDKTPRTIGYHVKEMTRERILRVERDGRENRCYINDEAIEADHTDLSGGYVETDKYTQTYSNRDSILRQI